jgi:hypothetical protein
LLSQDKKVSTFKVGKRNISANATQVITFDAAATGGTFKISYGSTAVCTAAIEYNTAVATIESALEGLTGITSVTVTRNGSVNPTEKLGFTVVFDGADAETDFDELTVHVSALTSVTAATVTTTVYGSETEDWDKALSALQITDNDWYCLLPGTYDSTAILSLADVIETNTKIMIACTNASAVYTTTSSFSMTLAANGYDRTALLAMTDSKTDWDNCCWAGRCLPETAGSVNWANMNLKSTTGNGFTAAQIARLVSAKTNWIETSGGYTVVPGTTAGQPGNVGGIMVSGEFIDVIRGGDQLVARIHEKMWEVIVQNK